jgi:hypothetical protein
MSSSEIMGVGVLALSFTLYSCFVRITDHMLLKCSSLSFSATSSLVFYALIHKILLLWLDVRPEGHQQGAGAVPGVVILDVPLCPRPDKTGWPDLGNRTIQFGGHHKLVSTSVLVSAFTSRSMFFSAATSSILFSMSALTSPLAEDSLLGPVLP